MTAVTPWTLENIRNLPPVLDRIHSDLKIGI
jgi:hypothetical protein